MENSPDDFNFGKALEHLKSGMKVARRGWNGKDMFLYHVPGGSYPTQTEVAKKEFGESVSYGPYIAIKTVSGLVLPWLASQADVLVDDWHIVE